MRNYTKINLDSLTLDSMLDFDLFIQRNQENKYILYRSKNLPFKEKNRTHLLNKGINVFISNLDTKKYINYIEKNLGSILSDKSVNLTMRGEIVYDVSQSIIQDLFSSPRSSEILKRTSDVVTNTSNFVLGNFDVFHNLMEIMVFDYTTYSHSVNVCIFSIGLSKIAGITDPDELHEIGLGAILHDIGKSKIDKEILLKRGALDEDEWKIIKTHPELGIELMQEAISLTPTINNIIRYHHENFDGNGYPGNLSGDKIPLPARIVKICDVFDALTTNRPYKEAIQSYPALDIMKNDMPGHFDTELLHLFIKLI